MRILNSFVGNLFCFCSSATRCYFYVYDPVSAGAPYQSLNWKIELIYGVWNGVLQHHIDLGPQDRRDVLTLLQSASFGLVITNKVGWQFILYSLIWCPSMFPAGHWVTYHPYHIRNRHIKRFCYVLGFISVSDLETMKLSLSASLPSGTTVLKGSCFEAHDVNPLLIDVTSVINHSCKELVDIRSH